MQLGPVWAGPADLYPDDADSDQTLSSHWSTKITWPKYWPPIGRGWRMQIVTGGQTPASAAQSSLHGPVSSLKVGSWDVEALDQAWASLREARLRPLHIWHIQHPLPASGHQQPPAVTWSSSAQCRNWPHHPQWQCAVLRSKFIFLHIELIVERIKIVGILGKSVSLFLEVSSLLSHWAVGMRQKDKIILGLYLHLFLYNLFNLRAQLTFLRWYNLFW